MYNIVPQIQKFTETHGRQRDWNNHIDQKLAITHDVCINVSGHNLFIYYKIVQAISIVTHERLSIKRWQKAILIIMQWKNSVLKIDV